MILGKSHSLYSWILHPLATRKALTTAVKLGSSPPEWLHTHDDIWPFVLPKDAVLKLTKLGKNEPWEKAKAELVAVTGAGQLGKRLFGYAMKEIADSEVTTIINEAAESIWDMGSITRLSIADLTRKTEEKLSLVEGVQSLDGTRVVDVDYRGYVVQLQVKDLPQQVFLTFQATVRGYAAEAGTLEELPAEKQLCGSSSRAKDGVVEAGMLRDAASARAYARKVLQAADGRDGKTMMDRNQGLIEK